jgi:DNA transposition AAA+ family ATPase
MARMTPKQLRKFLDDAGMSQRGAAREIGIGERTMRRYIAGDQPIPTTVEYALRWIASQPRKPN